MFSPGLVQPRLGQALAELAEAAQLRLAAVLAWVLDEAPPVPLRGQRCDRQRPAFIRQQLIDAINAERRGAAVIDWRWDAGSQSVAGLLLNSCGVHDFQWRPATGEISLSPRIGLQQTEWLPLEAVDAWDPDSEARGMDCDADWEDQPDFEDQPELEDQPVDLLHWLRSTVKASEPGVAPVIRLRSCDGDAPGPCRQW